MGNRVDLATAVSVIGAQPAVPTHHGWLPYRSGLFQVDGTLTGCTATLQAQNPAGNWCDVPNSSVTVAPAIVEVSVPQSPVRLNLTAGSCSGISAWLFTP